MVDASSTQFFGSQEHRVQVSRAIKEGLWGKNTRSEGITSGQTVKHQTPQAQWEMPKRDITFEGSNGLTTERKDSHSCDLLAPIQLGAGQTVRPQSCLFQDITSATRSSLPPLSPPISHKQSPQSLHCSQFECAQRDTWSLSPHTPPSPSPKLPWGSLSQGQPYSQQELVAQPTLPEIHDSRKPLSSNVEWDPIPRHPDGADVDEIISLIDSEIALHEIRERYEEAVARGLLARHNAMFARRQRAILKLQLKLQCRQKI